jgi:uncharacterized membrane protein YedE/YeeE
MPRAILLALALVAIGTVLAVLCMVETTALSMTMLFSVSIPAFGLAALLYVVEVVRDLRRHRVL